ncbi:hypothetical protein ASF40_10440 [Microbacterium sp. Leaf288]|uniref:peptidase S8 n=1 Tax=Microbacterium sp. Leaf288 TaxID=1736323 RepID=UPI0006F46E65|nr:peptidase S8 [Microbacterium sp. Leaf288]KQP70228.1 hypothetical protein ASF40_10440 [Microbacterium sp. Leaf288]
MAATSGGSSRKRTSAPRAELGASAPLYIDGDDVIPGEVIVTLKADAADAMTASVPIHPGGRGVSMADSLGVSGVDAVLARLGAYDITRLAPPSQGIARSVMALDGVPEPEESILGRSFRVRIDAKVAPDKAAAELDALDEVEVAEPNRWREASVIPDDPQFGAQWGLTKINAPDAWDVTKGSASVVVAVIDSGVDLDHPELAPLLVPGFDMVDLGPNPTPNPGWRFEGDFAGRDAIPEDEVGHGTHVAGTIAAVSNNAVGVAGVGWQTRIMPIKALTRVVRISDGRVSGTGSSADVAAAIRYAADNGAHVINMSLGSPSSTSVEASAVAYAVSKGVVVVAAMGNDGSSSPSFPAAYPDVIAVAAIQSNESRAAFSQTGPHIDISAPGVGILSTYLAGGLATMAGTSMASPHVAGVAALVKAVKPSLTATEIGDILRSTAKPLRDVASDPVPNDRYGWGLLDASAAVLKARGPIVLKPTITVKLRTPVVACVPRTITLPECGTIKTVLPLQCKKIKSIHIACPVTTTVTKVPTTVTGPGPGPQPGGADPFGVEQGDYEAGFAAGYAAAIEELQSGGGDAYGEGLFDE